MDYKKTIVVDANIIIAALIRNSKVRRILSKNIYEFVSPDFVLEEIEKYKDYICEKSGLKKEDINILIVILLQTITIISAEEYKSSLSKALEIMKNDKKDVPYVACYLAWKCDAIWTNDKDFEGKEGITIIKTEYFEE